MCRDDSVRNPATITDRIAVLARPRPQTLVADFRNLMTGATATVALRPGGLGGGGSTAPSSLRCHRDGRARGVGLVRRRNCQGDVVCRAEDADDVLECFV